MKRTTDISDAMHPLVQYLEPIYKSYGKKLNFDGEIATIKCFEDNSLIKEVVSTNGEGKVLVIDAGGSQRCAMFGDQLASKAITYGWAGLIIYGFIRDSDIINTMSIGIKALGTYPLKSVKKGVGEKNIKINFSGVNFIPGHYLYADQDGVIILQNKITC